MFKILTASRFRKIKEENSRLGEKVLKANYKLEELNEQLKLNKERIERLSYLVNERCRNASIRITETHKGVGVLVSYSEKEKEFEIFDLGVNFSREDRKLVLWWQYRERGVYLIDIQGGASCGHGTLALDILKSCASEMNIKTIYGRLAVADWHNRERQLAFYRKNGFEITDAGSEKRDGEVVFKFKDDFV